MTLQFMCGLVPAVLRIEGEDVDDEELTQAAVRSLSLDPAESDRYILVQVLRFVSLSQFALQS